MVIFYKKWNKHNEIQLTKNKISLRQSKNDKSSTLPRNNNNNIIIIGITTTSGTMPIIVADNDNNNNISLVFPRTPLECF